MASRMRRFSNRGRDAVVLDSLAGARMSRSLIFSLALLTSSATSAHAASPEPAPEPAPAPDPAPEQPEDPPEPPVKPDVPEPQKPLPDAPKPEVQVAPQHRGVDVPVQPVLRFEHHGQFRFRPEILFGGDLGPGDSAVPEPIGVTTGVEPDDGTLAWASVRLRYEPTMFIGSNLEIHVGLDALDNYILGSNPEGAGRADLLTDTLNGSQEPPSAGSNGWRDALVVRQAWARWMAFDMLDLRVGRMVDHYGLGLYRNDGACEDCDFGTVVDRVALGFTISGFRIGASWEMTAEGVTSDMAFAADRGADGQPKDIAQIDDVSTYTLMVGRFATTLAEQRERERLLVDKREWVIDWSLFSAFIDQVRSSSEQIDEASVECAAQGELANGQPIQPYDCIRLFQRDAFFWRPGAWFRAEMRPAMDEQLRIEVELAGMFGEIAHPQRFVEDGTDEGKTFQGLGLAFELDWQAGALGLGLDAGFATGDDGEFNGVLDGQDVVDPDDDAYATNDALRGNRNITAFYFNRDYHLDQVLFRQVIGAVTNAVYFKPWVSYTLLHTDTMKLSARFDALYALAMRPSGTPGDGDSWGVELDARLALELTSGFNASLTGGLLIPLDALQNRDTGESADLSGALRALIGWQF